MHLQLYAHQTILIIPDFLMPAKDGLETIDNMVSSVRPRRSSPHWAVGVIPNSTFLSIASKSGADLPTVDAVSGEGFAGAVG